MPDSHSREIENLRQRAEQAEARLAELEKALKAAEHRLVTVGEYVSGEAGLHPDVLPSMEETLAQIRAALSEAEEPLLSGGLADFQKHHPECRYYSKRRPPAWECHPACVAEAEEPPEPRPLQVNPEPLRAAERREEASVASFAEWAATRSRDDRLRVWLALGGAVDDFPEPVAAPLPEDEVGRE
jgi:hypothetical protein